MKLPIKRLSRDVYNWDPFEEMKEIQEEMQEMFRRFPLLDTQYRPKTFSPLTDVAEEENKVTVTMDLPGVEKENVELSMKDNILVISAEKGKQDETEKEGYLRKGRVFMRYYREIELPQGVTEEEANAQLKNGVLTVILPKIKQLKLKKIQID
jgi:HSP20 family protein